MSKNQKYREYDENIMGGGENYDFMGQPNMYDAGDDGYNQPTNNNQFKRFEGTNFKDSKHKGRGGKQNLGGKKDYNGFGGGKPSSTDPDAFFNNYDDFNSGADFKRSQFFKGFPENNQPKKYKPPKEDFGAPLSGNKPQYNSTNMKGQGPSGVNKKNLNKDDKPEKMQFYNSNTQYELDDNFSKLKLHGNEDEMGNFNYGDKSNNDNINKKGKKKKKNNNQGKFGNNQPHGGDRGDDYDMRKNQKRQDKGGNDPFEERSGSSELGNENENIQGMPNMMQPMYMQQVPNQGQMQPQFMHPGYMNNYQMMNQVRPQGGMYPPQFNPMQMNNHQFSNPQMQQFYAPRIGQPNYGQGPYQNFVQPQIGGMQNMMYDPSRIRLPPNNQQQFNQGYPMQNFKPSEQLNQFNNLQIMQSQMFNNKEINEKSHGGRGPITIPGNQKQPDSSSYLNQQIQDMQGRMKISGGFNQRNVGNPMFQPGMFPGMHGYQQPQVQNPTQNPNFQMQQSMPNPNMILNQNWMMKQEDNNNEKDSDSNQDLNQNKDPKLSEYGQHEMTNQNHLQENQHLFRPHQDTQYPGYDFKSGKSPYQPQQSKIPYGGFNFPYSEEAPQDFYKSEMKLSESKYLQEYQKFNQSQEKLDVNAKEYVPNQNLIN